MARPHYKKKPHDGAEVKFRVSFPLRGNTESPSGVWVVGYGGYFIRCGEVVKASIRVAFFDEKYNFVASQPAQGVLFDFSPTDDARYR